MKTPLTIEEVLNKYGRLVYSNKGNSMFPLLRENRDIMVVCKSSSPFNKFDVVLFKRCDITNNPTYVLHRIIKVNDDKTYWIVGDNCITGETVREENILGVLNAVIRNGKTIFNNNIGYRLYVNTWCRWFHLRFFILRTARFIKMCAQKIFNNKK